MPARRLVVLGMHRSGTSLLANAAHRLGASLPATPMPPAADNPEGFFESAPLVAVNDAILARAGSGWADWRKLETAGFAAADPGLAREMGRVFAAEFGTSAFPVWKDPRLAALLPIWRPLLDAEGAATLALVSFRSPGAVARSLARRDGIPPGLAVLLWLRHLLDAERHTRDLPRAFVSFDALVADWRSALLRAGAALRLAWPVAPDRVAAPVVRPRPADDPDPPEIASAYAAVWCRHALEACRALEAGALDRDGTGPRAVLDRLRDQFDDACRLFGGERRLAEEAAPRHAGTSVSAAGPASASGPVAAYGSGSGSVSVPASAAGRLVLDDVTVLAADTRTPRLAAHALGRALAIASFADAVLFTDRPVETVPGVRVAPVGTFADFDAYGRFLAGPLAALVETSHVLVVQWDGWPLDASAWDPGFLRHDYVGARWAGRPDGASVGNGGFSLRSRRLLVALRDDPRLALRPGFAEDEQIGGAFRPILERDHGIVFAPEAVADRFSRERILSAAPSFGFHGAFNLWRHCDDAALLGLAADLPDGMRHGRAVVELASFLRRTGRAPPADALDPERPADGAGPDRAALDTASAVGHDPARVTGKADPPG